MGVLEDYIQALEEHNKHYYRKQMKYNQEKIKILEYSLKLIKEQKGKWIKKKVC